MTEWHATLYGEDAERAAELEDRLDAELVGSVDGHAELVRTCMDLAEQALQD